MLPVLVIIAVCLCVYWPTVSRRHRYAYVIDDIDWHQKWGHRLPNLSSRRNLLEWLSIYFYAGGQLGFYPRRDHAISIALHTLVCIAVYIYAQSVCTHPLAAALLYAVHPINHSTAIWVTGRRYQLLTLTAIALLASPLPLLAPVVVIATLCRPHPERANLIKHRASTCQYGILLLKSLGFQLTKSVLPICKYQISFLYTFLQGYRHESGANPYRPDSDLVIGLLWLVAAISLCVCQPHLTVPVATILAITVSTAAMPTSQLVADRYMSVPTILVCTILAPVAIVLLPVYTVLLLQLMPMYRNINAFYHAHPVNLHKRKLLQVLYPQIVTKS